MTWAPGKRTERRVGYRETVRMLPVGAEEGILGRGVNVSPAGILVDAPTSIPVGAELLCDLALPDGAATVRGRVARLQPPPEADAGASVRVGIAFVDLSTHDASALRRLVDERDRVLRVAVLFEGLSQPVRSAAALTDEGFRLTTALPFLRLGSSVEVATSSDARVFARGVVRRVALESGQLDGIPRLMIDLGLATHAGADGDGVPTAEGAAAPHAQAATATGPVPEAPGADSARQLRRETSLEAEEWDPHTVSIGRLRLLRPPPTILLAVAAGVILVIAAAVAAAVGLRSHGAARHAGAPPMAPATASLPAPSGAGAVTR
jgi:PilZ domain